MRRYKCVQFVYDTFKQSGFPFLKPLSLYTFFRNALSLALLDELKSRLVDASTDNKVKVLILGHTGSVFSAGHDLKELVRSHLLRYKIIFLHSLFVWLFTEHHNINFYRCFLYVSMLNWTCWSKLWNSSRIQSTRRVHLESLSLQRSKMMLSYYCYQTEALQSHGLQTVTHKAFHLFLYSICATLIFVLLSRSSFLLHISLKKLDQSSTRKSSNVAPRSWILSK